jgi:hypothetical protein
MCVSRGLPAHPELMRHRMISALHGLMAGRVATRASHDIDLLAPI